MAAPAAREIRFDDQVAIITGAGRGLGYEHALLLAKRGAHVIVNDLAADSLDPLVEKIKADGGSAIAVAGSVAEFDVTKSLVESAIEKYSRVDIVINNAGIEIAKDFVDYTAEDLSRLLDVHVRGSWNLTQLAWPHMMKRKYGKVLIVSSTSVFGMSKNAAYVTAKGALFGLGKALAAEGADHGIDVNIFGPSAMTPMAEEVLGTFQFERMKKVMTVSTTSSVVAWLVHPDCKATGEFITSYGRSVGRVFLGETKGSYNPDGPFDPETVRDAFEQALDMKDFIMPKTVVEGLGLLLSIRSIEF